MKNQVAIEVEDVSKLYRLGTIGTGTISHDLNRLFSKIAGKEDPYEKLGQLNDRTAKGSSDYVWALKNISFNVQKGEVLGVIGQNGAGKSTLLKILSKITAPTTGRIKVNGRIASLLEVGTGFHPEMTGRENAYLNGAILGMRKKEITAKLDAIIDFAGVERYIDTPVKRYSSGMKVRLGFAVAAHLEPEILIVDEVLAVGDADFQKKCIGKMKDVSSQEGRTILFVSHNMAAINRLCTRAVLMSRGGVIADGTVEAITSLYLNNAQKTNEIHLDHPFIKYINVAQVEDRIKIAVNFESQKKLTRPIIGFIISDSNGNRIFGSNPQHQPPSFDIPSANSGTVSVNISYPKLLDGTYLLSVYLTDSFLGDVAAIENIVSFDVKDMVHYHKYGQLSVLGPVSPVLEWHYDCKEY